MFTRRRFLKLLGLGAGAPLLMPALHSILRAEDAAHLPRRVVIFVEGNGLEPSALMSQATQQAILAAGGQAQRYAYRGYRHQAPLIVERAALSDARGLGALGAQGGQASLQDKAAVVLGLSSTITGGGHSTGYGALSATRSGGGIPAGPTLDAALAALPHVRARTPFEAVRLGVEDSRASVGYSACAFGAKRPAPILINPTAAFHVLFGSVAQGEGRQVFLEKGELLDFARADVRRSLSAFSGSSQERAKLEAYLASLEELITRQESIAQLGPALEAVKPAEPSEQSLYASADPFDRLHAQVDLLIAALLGGLTSVGVVTMGTQGFSLEYPALLDLYPDKKMMGGHDMRHGAEHHNEDCLNVLHAVTQRYIGQAARLARALDAVPELGQSGSMLDHTLILYMSDNGEKHHSDAAEWPALLLGGKALGMQTDGRAVVYPKRGESAHRQMSNLFNSIGHAAGAPLDEFGAEGASRVAPGPLSELWRARG